MLNDTLARIDALKAAFEALQPLKPEHEQRLWQKLRLEWNYNSNHIEGNTLTYGETFLLLVHGQTHGGHSMREFEEMKAHDVAVSMVKAWSADKERPLNENDVRSLNAVLLKEPFWKEAITADGQPTRIEVIPGQYKKTGNVVRQPDGSLFHYASPDEVPARMQELMAWYSSSNDLHPVQKAAILHHRFIVIHPFGDGNGRTARLLVNYHLMRHGLMPLVVKSADKANYLRCLKLADAGDLTSFAEYLADAEVWALELAVKAAKGEPLEEEDDWKKRGDLLRKELEQQDKDSTRGERDHQKKMLSALDDLYIPLVSSLDDIASAHRSFFDMAQGHVKLTKAGGTEVRFGQIFPGSLAEEKARVVDYIRTSDFQPRIQLSYDLSGFKHGKELRRWFILNWFFEDGGMRLEFVPREAGPMNIPYGVPWNAVDRSFVSKIAEWIQNGIRSASAS